MDSHAGWRSLFFVCPLLGCVAISNYFYKIVARMHIRIPEETNPPGLRLALTSVVPAFPVSILYAFHLSIPFPRSVQHDSNSMLSQLAPHRLTMTVTT